MSGQVYVVLCCVVHQGDVVCRWRVLLIVDGMNGIELQPAAVSGVSV